MAEFDGRLNFTAGIDFSEVNKDADELFQTFSSGAVKMSEAFNIGKSVNANRAQLRTLIANTKQTLKELQTVYDATMQEIAANGGLKEASEQEKQYLENLKNGIKAARAEVDGFQQNLKQQNFTKGSIFGGLANGLQGLMGAYTAASGVMAQFNVDQEEMAKIQTKLQSSMSILMGMQQLYNTLQSTSQFRLQVVTKFTELYAAAQAKLAISTGALKLALGGIVAVLAAASAALIAYASKHNKAAEEENKLIESTYKQVAAYRALQAEWKQANGELEKQEKILESDKWKELGISVNDVNDAEKVLVSESENVTKALFARAKAAAAYEQAQKEIKKAMKEELKANKTEETMNTGNLNLWQKFVRGGTGVLGDKDYQKLLKDTQEQVESGLITIYERQRQIDEYVQNNKTNPSLKKVLNRRQNRADERYAEADKYIQKSTQAEQEYSAWLESLGINLENTNNDVKKILEERKRQLEELASIISNSIIKVEDYEDELIPDEGDKTLAKMKRSHQRKLAEMEKEAAELEQAYVKSNEMMGVKNTNANGLTGEQQSEIDRFYTSISAMGQQFAKEEDTLQTKTLTDLLAKYRGFGEQYEAITKEYEENRAKIIASKTTENAKEVEDALWMLEDAYKKSVSSIGDAFASSDKNNDFTKWVENLANSSLMDLEVELQVVKDNLELTKEMFPENSDAIVELSAAYDILVKAIKEFNSENEDAVSDADKWTDIALVIDTVRDSFIELGQTIGGSLGEAVSAVGTTLTSLSSLSNALSKLEKEPDNMAAKMSVVSTAIQGVASIVGMVVNQIKSNKEATEEWSASVKQCAHEFAMLQLEEMQYSQKNMFGVENPYQKAIDGAKLYAGAMEELYKMQADFANAQVQTGTKEVWSAENTLKGVGYGAAAGAAIGSIIPGLGTLIGGAIGAVVGGLAGALSTEVVPVFEDLSKTYGEIFDKETMKLNPQILADYDKLDDKTKQLVDNWDEVVEKVEEARKEMQDNFKELAGDVGTQLSDALVAAFSNGDVYNAVDDFKEYTTSAIESIIEQMVFDQAFGDLFTSLEQRFNDSFLGENSDQDIIDDLIWFSEQYESRLAEYEKYMNAAQSAMGAQGYDLWSRDRSAATKMSLGASQDSVDESNGRLTTIQGHTFEINENVKAMRVQIDAFISRSADLLIELQGIHRDTSNIDAVLADVHSDLKDVKLNVGTIVDRGITTY